MLVDLQHAVAVHPAAPMLADTRVVAMSVAPDGRIVLGLEDRGVVFLTVPERFVNNPVELPHDLPAWESRRPHEPAFQDGSIVLRSCRAGKETVADAGEKAFLGELLGYARRAEPRTRVEMEPVFEGRPDIAVRGANLETLQADVLAMVAKHNAKAPVAVWQRQGPRGTAAVQVKYCSNK